MKNLFWQLISDSSGKRVSHTKVWTNIAYLSATIAFMYLVYEGRDSVDIWLVYLGTLAGHATASKFISHKLTDLEKSDDSS